MPTEMFVFLPSSIFSLPSFYFSLLGGFFIVLFRKNLSFPQEVCSNDTRLSGFMFHQNYNIKQQLYLSIFKALISESYTVMGRLFQVWNSKIAVKSKVWISQA